MKNRFLQTIVNRIRNFPLNEIILSLVLLCIGIVLIFLSDAIIRIVFIVSGVLLLLFTIYRFLLLFSSHARSLHFYLLFLCNLFLLLFALAMIFCAERVLSVVGLFIGLYLTVSNAYKLYRLIVFSPRDKQFWVSLSLTSLAVLIGCFLVFAPHGVAGLLSLLVGIALLYAAISDIVFFVLEYRRDQSSQSPYIEVDYEDKT